MPESPTLEEKHARLKTLLQDRKSSTKGRASRPMAVCLDAELSMDLEDADRELAEAKQALAEAEATGDARVGGKVAVDPELTARVETAEKAVADAEALVDAASVVVTFTALKADEYDKLKDEHPPREGNEYDAIAEYNRETFPDALMAASASKKVRDADGNLVDLDVDDIIAGMSNGERTMACQVSNDVNLRTSTFSEANSRNRRRSGSNSNRR